jgi:hypothetical protein
MRDSRPPTTSEIIMQETYTDLELLTELIERNKKLLAEEKAANRDGRVAFFTKHILESLRVAAWEVKCRGVEIAPPIKKPERTDPIDPWDRVVRLPRKLVEVCNACGGDYDTCARRRCWGFVNRDTVIVEESP